MCDNHAGPQQIATGSTSVFFNTMPAARLGDDTVCDSRISTASDNVIIGGGTASYASVRGEVPAALVDVAAAMAIGGTAVALGAGGAAAYAAAGWAGVGVFGLQAGAGFAGGAVGEAVGGAIGQAAGGARGEAWGEVGGGLLGGVGAGAAAGRLGSALTSTAGTVPGEQILQVRSAEDVNAEMVAAGADPAWQPGTMVTTKVVPAGTNYNMVMSEGQATAIAQGEPRFGAWASGDTVDSQSYTRDGLAIQPHTNKMSPMLGRCRQHPRERSIAEQVGPQGDLAGGASQVQFLGDRNLQLSSMPQSLRYNNPSFVPSIGAVAGTNAGSAESYMRDPSNTNH